jgi:hypothetical protein
MENQVWVYTDPRKDYLIVKRFPFWYQIPVYDLKLGTEMIEYIQGVCIECPKWEQRTVNGTLIFAKANNRWYEISDLEAS